MKKIYFIAIALIGLTAACTKDFEEYNTDSKHPKIVPGNLLFANAQKTLSDQMASTNVNENVWKLWAQYWTETTYTDEANYDIVNRTIADYQFRVFYRDILRDLDEARILITAEQSTEDNFEEEKANKYVIIDIMEIFAYQQLVDIFGNVPYTETLDTNNISPKYDDAYTIYTKLITRINNDINNLDLTHGSFGTNDIYFGGDVSMWKKFAYTLKLKLGIMLSDIDASLAKQTVESAYLGILSPSEKCQVKYESGINSNPIYQELVQTGRHDFVPTNTLVDKLTELNDPRIDNYITTLDGEYVGGIYGESNNWSQCSHVAEAIQAQTYPNTIIDGTEALFYLAEAAARGMNVGGTAEDLYNAAVTQSILDWNGTATEAAEYLAQPSVAYDQANWKEKIGTQAWIAFYIRGFEGYTSWRRLDYPVLNLAPAPETSDGSVPVRFTYPINEQTLNATNYYEAAAAIGGDELTTKLFWDKY